MEKLLTQIKKLQKGPIKDKINKRISEFKDIDKNSSNELYSELCFCILTANFNAEKTIKIQNKIGEKFCDLNQEKLSEQLKKLGHRYPNARAKYISESKKCKDSLINITSKLNKEDLREWLVKNVKGLGYKESSHFLRNIGFDDYAIIDFHIIDLLVRHKIIKKPKTISKKIYLETEKKLKEIAENTDLTLAELDLYLWYMETGKILK